MVDELLAALVEDPGEAAVDLCQWNEIRLGEVHVGHVPAVELVEAAGEPGTALEPRAQAVAGAPRVCPQPQRGRGLDEPAHELRIPLETAGREQERRRRRPAWARRDARRPPARTSASVRPAGSNRTPVVSGLPVSRSTTGAPRASSQSSPSSSRS